MKTTTLVAILAVLLLPGCKKAEDAAASKPDASPTGSAPDPGSSTPASSAVVELNLTNRVGQARVPVGQTLRITLEESAGVQYGDPVVTDPPTLAFDKRTEAKDATTNTVSYTFRAVKPGMVNVTIPYSKDGKLDPSQNAGATVMLGN